MEQKKYFTKSEIVQKLRDERANLENQLSNDKVNISYFNNVFSGFCGELEKRADKESVTVGKDNSKKSLTAVYDFEQVKQTLFQATRLDCSVEAATQQGYLSYTSKATVNEENALVTIKFEIGYKGLIKNVLECGIETKANTIREACIDYLEPQANGGELPIVKAQIKKFYGLQTIPDIDWLSDDSNALLSNYTWKDSDVAGVIVITKNIETKNEYTAFYTIASLIERCMDVETDYKTKKITRKYKNQIMKKHIESKATRRTDAIEILIVRAIRHALKMVPNVKLQQILNILDQADINETSQNNLVDTIKARPLPIIEDHLSNNIENKAPSDIKFKSVDDLFEEMKDLNKEQRKNYYFGLCKEDQNIYKNNKDCMIVKFEEYEKSKLVKQEINESKVTKPIDTETINNDVVDKAVETNVSLL